VTTVCPHIETCPFRPVPCGYGCRQRGNTNAITQVKACELQQHMDNECPLRPVPCKFVTCKWAKSHCIKAQDLEAHELICPERLLSCPLGCPEQMKLRDQADHLPACPNNIQPCPRECGLRLPLFQHQAHVRNDCPHRDVFCPLGCQLFPFKLMAKDVAHHTAYECPNRISTLDAVARPYNKSLHVGDSTLNVPGVTGSAAADYLTCQTCGIRLRQDEMPCHASRCIHLVNTRGCGMMR